MYDCCLTARDAWPFCWPSFARDCVGCYGDVDDGAAAAEIADTADAVPVNVAS